MKNGAKIRLENIALADYFSNAILFKFAVIYVFRSHYFYSFSQELLQASTYTNITNTSTSFNTFTSVLLFVSARIGGFCRPEKLHKKMLACTPSQLLQIFAKILFRLCLENRIDTMFV